MNNGQSWTQIAPFWAADTKVKDLAANSKTFFALISNGDFYRSEDNGQSWRLANAGLPRTPVHRISISGSSLFINAGDGAYLSTDEGQTWRHVLGGLKADSIVAVNNNSLAVVANTFSGDHTMPINVSVSVNSGQTWKEEVVFRGQILYFGQASALAVIGESAVVGVTISSDGDDYGSFVFTDSRRIDLPYRAFVNDMVVSETRVFMATGGGIYLLNATDLTEINTSLVNRQAQSIALAGTNLFAGSNGGGVNILTNTVQSWDAANAGLTAKAVNALVTNGGSVIAGTGGGGVFRSVDQDWNWSPSGSGLPPQAHITSLVARGNSLFAGTFGTGVYFSSDYGERWIEVNGGLANRSVHTVTVNGGAVLAGTDGGGVFVSTNNGQSWSAANDGLTNRVIYTLTTVGNRIFAGTDVGIFISDNNGASWRSASTGLPANALAVRSIAAVGNALFAGTIRAGIYRSTDGGTSWNQVNNGLPPTLFVSSFAVSGSKVYAGTVFGVFVTTDQGQSWTQLNAGLLNIYVASLAVNGQSLLAGTQGGGVFTSQIPD